MMVMMMSVIDHWKAKISAQEAMSKI